MLKKFVTWLLTINLVIIAVGCTSINQQSQPTLSNLFITPDNSDGIFAAYRLVGTARDNSVKLQRINSEGTTIWNNTLYESDNSRVNVVGMIEGANNQVLVALDILDPEDGNSSYRFDHSSLVKMDSQGQIQWNKNFYEEGMQVIADSMGGAIVAWATEGYFHALHLDAQGNELWNSPICNSGEGLKLASNDDGESFFLWDNSENPYFVVQKLGADGAALWGQEGMPEGVRIKYLATNLQQQPQITSDGEGGAIITWAEVLEQQASYVWILRISANGHVLWYTPVYELAATVNPRTEVVSDDSGGGIIFWEDHRQGMAVYAQKADTEGQAVWKNNGLPMITELSKQSPQFSAVSDGTGGAIISWIDGDGKLYIQNIDAAGNKKWGESGLLVANNAARIPIKITKTNTGEIVLGWQTGNPDHPQGAFIQKIDSSGKLVWGADGIELSTGSVVTPSNPYPSLTPPWSDKNIYTDEETTINVDIFQDFVIRYDYHHNLFPTFKVTSEPPDKVNLIEKRTSEGQNFDMDGVIWFLFQAINEGDTSVTIEEFTHQSDVVQSQKTFKVHVTQP